MSAKGNFRIRSQDPTKLTRGVSTHSQNDNWFDYLKQRKLNCLRNLENHYDSINTQQTQLRNVIRGASSSFLERDKEEPELSRQELNSGGNGNPNINTNTHSNTNPEVKRQASQSLRAALRAITHLRGQAELIPSKVDNFQLNRKLVSKVNDSIWNKISQNPKQKQVLLFKAHDVEFGELKGCCFKVSKCHKKYIIRVFNLQQKHGMVIGKEEWERIWEECGESYEGVMARVGLLPEGKMVIRGKEEGEGKKEGQEA